VFTVLTSYDSVRVEVENLVSTGTVEEAANDLKNWCAHFMQQYSKGELKGEKKEAAQVFLADVGAGPVVWSKAASALRGE
jgi:hypothetical protein